MGSCVFCVVICLQQLTPIQVLISALTETLEPLIRYLRYKHTSSYTSNTRDESITQT